MKTSEYDGAAFSSPRSHPWTEAAASSDFRYYDLKSEPALIRTALEDLSPWAHYAAIQQFYALLEAVNGAASPLESNDCAFSGPHPNDSGLVKSKYECTGRIMVLFRELERNLEHANLAALKHGIHMALGPIDPSFENGIVGTTLIPVRYLTLPAEPAGQLGQELMVSFWAWGDSEADVMANFDRLMKNLAQGFAQLIREITGE